MNKINQIRLALVACWFAVVFTVAGFMGCSGQIQKAARSPNDVYYGNVTPGQNTRTFADNNSYKGVTGRIPSPIQQDGSGSITKSGANTYTGGTTISGGAFDVGGSTKSGSGGEKDDAVMLPEPGNVTLPLGKKETQFSAPPRIGAGSSSGFGKGIGTGAGTGDGSGPLAPFGVPGKGSPSPKDAGGLALANTNPNEATFAGTIKEGGANLKPNAPSGVPPTQPASGPAVRATAKKQAIQYYYDTMIDQANQHIADGRFDQARAAIDRAKVARDTDPDTLTSDEKWQLDATIAATTNMLTKAREEDARAKANRVTSEASQAERNRLSEDGATRIKTTVELTRIARLLVDEGRLTQARGVVGQILVIDPTNEDARALKLRIARLDHTPIPASQHQLDREELWIISKCDVSRREIPPDDSIPGSGTLLARKSQTELVPVPLQHTDVKASITGYIATTRVTQQYQNPYDSKIEAVYVFPLPHNAAVNEFVMTVGDRKIRGIIRDREEAKQIYEEAKHQGYVASLLQQERPNIFTQSVANIEPGKSIDIDIKYFNTLAYVDGWYEYVFPMVVGPRFNPASSLAQGGNGIGAVGVGSRGASGQRVEIQYQRDTGYQPVRQEEKDHGQVARATQRNGHDISLAVEIDAGVKIEEIQSINHRVNSLRKNDSTSQVVLAADDTLPNKDFVLRYKVAGKKIKSAMVVQKDARGEGGYFTLMLYPPADLKELDRKPLEMVFTLDVSGSMSGQPIEQAKQAIRYALQHMDDRDTFQIIRFANGASQFAPQPVPADGRNIVRAMQFIESTEAGGGTYMIEGIRGSLNFPHDEHRLRFVSFLTDGFIGNESEILTEVQKSIGPSRIFSFGVGSSCNRYLLDHMAKLGNGAVSYLSLNDDPNEVMKLFFDRISHPAMTDVSVDFGGMKVAEIYPRRAPDLFVGRPVILTGRFTGWTDRVTLHGTIDGEKREFVIPVNLAASTHTGIASVWARTKIADVADRAFWEPNQEWDLTVKETALEYGLMSQFTSFLAVDTSTRTNGMVGTTVAVPVPVPDGVRYETTVQEK